MKKFILICLCNAALLLALCLPAQARIVVGLAPIAPLTRIDQTSLNKLSEEFTASAGAAVKIRRFDNDAAITNWLLRFQEIDAAIVSLDFIRQQPAGTLRHLVDLHAKNSSYAPLAVVVRSNQSSDSVNQIKAAFLKTGKSGNGQKLLGGLGVAGITLPGEVLKRKAAIAASAPAQPVKEKPQPVARTKQPAPQPQKKVTASPKKPAVKALVPVAPVVTKKQPGKEQTTTAESAPKAEPKAEAKAEPKVRIKPAAEIATKPAGKSAPTTEVRQKPAKQPEAKEQPEAKSQISKPEKPATVPEPK
ncbi:MAG: hypothetical protein KAU27_06390, partial [Desulfuromonadales bacterium]|nr:hypothetical protein [Desulfuromonadales bacterium]